MKTAILTAAWLLGSSTVAHASCTLTHFVAPGLSATYDPFDDTFSPSPTTLIAQAGGDCVGARVQFAVSPSPSHPQTGSQLALGPGGSQLAVTIQDGGGQPKPILNPSAAFNGSPPSYTVGSAGQVNGGAALQLGIAPGQVVTPGTYGALLNLLARVTDAKGAVTESSTPLQVSVTIKPSVRLAAGSGDLRIDVGEIESGALSSFVKFDAYSNIDYEFSIRSDNGFALRRSGGAANAANAPYDLVFSDGATTKLLGATTRSVSFDTPPSGIRRHTLRVRVGKVSDLPAGAYNDLMTVEISARL